MKRGTRLIEHLYKSTQAKMVTYPPSMDVLEKQVKRFLAAPSGSSLPSPCLEPKGVFYIDNANFNMCAYPLPKLMLNVLRHIEIEKTLVGYNLLGGRPRLRDALAELARLRSGKTDPNSIHRWNVFVGNSASGLLDKIIQIVLLSSGDRNEVIFHYPVYPIFNFLILKHGGRPVPIRTTYGNKFLPSPKEIKERITPKTAAICLAYPCNPSGTTYTDKRPLEQIFSLAKEKGIVLIADEIYQDMMHDGKRHISALSLTDSLDGIVSVTSLSKDRPGLADLRVGYAIGDYRITSPLLLMASAQEWHVPSFIQDLLMFDTCMRIARRNGKYRHYLSYIGLNVRKEEAKDFNSSIDSLQGKMERHVKVLYHILAEAPWLEKIVKPEAGNLLFFKVRSRFLKKFNRRRAQESVILGRGNTFHVSPGEGRGWFRISVTHPIDYMLRAVYSLFRFSVKERNRLLADQIERELFHVPQDFRLLSTYASVLLNLKRYKQASRVLDRISPRGDILVRYQLCYLKGTLSLKRRQYKKGIEYLERAGRMPVENVEFFPEGRSMDPCYYSLLLNIFSKSRLYNNLSVVYSRLKRQKEADRCLKKAQALQGKGVS